jgi:hypothetical protein
MAKKLLFHLALAIVLLGAIGARPVSAQTQTAVEYYYAAWDYYFITSFPEEQAVLDGGAFGGVWKRTGQTFNVWSQPVANSFPACRFFQHQLCPKSSHFYTPFPAECTKVKNDPNWQYEAIAFYLQLPFASALCPSGTQVLYRMYNNGMGGAPNHRYTTSLTVLNQMVSAGWVFEGDGRNAAFACVPSAMPVRTTADGIWFGGTSANEQVRGIVLSNGTYYFIYTTPGTNIIAGVVQGTAVFSNGFFTSSDARDFNIIPYGTVFAGAISGAYVPQSYLQGTASASGVTKTVVGYYDADYDQPANLALAAGTFSGLVASSAGTQPATFTLSAAGAFSGSASGCTFSGTASPHLSVNVFDISVRFNGGNCIFGTNTVTGVAVYDAAFRQMYGSAPNATRTDGFLFLGTK